MAIRQLSLTDFRNLKSTTLEFDPGVNLVTGNNGSGKTSVLEAIFVLCQAHSFRTHQLKQCINHEQPGFLLFGRFDDFKAGLSKSAKKLEIHIDGESIKRRSELVRKSPINIVNADSFQLLGGPPQKRRAFLDWCLFHVEPEYTVCWAAFQHALKQRNRLLKTRQDLKLLDYWDQHLIEPSLRLSGMRKRYSEILSRIIGFDLEDMLGGLPFDLEYRQGWPGGMSLADAIGESRAQDIRRGFTGVGIHRDDLSLMSEDNNVTEVFSRGQGKRLCLTLLLAALKLVNKQRMARIILLIDDLHSELDTDAQKIIYQQLIGLDLQLFISNIDSVIPAPLGTKEFKMFHVEHGIIKPRNFS